MMRKRMANRLLILFTVVLTLLLAGCELSPNRMLDQPRYDTYETSTLFENFTSARPIPANTVPRGEWYELMSNEALYAGTVDGEYVEDFPIVVNQAVLRRGQQRYNIYCSPCHGRSGYGDGVIVQRGFPAPPSYHSERLREAPVGHFYDVITNGFGAMYSYAARVHPKDRWAIVAYIRALQLSQHAPLDELPAETRQQILTQVESQTEEENNESN